MGILDDAIKEHLELKRQHGAGDDELKKLEDEAFGAAERPGDEATAADPLAEAPTEFMTQPEIEQEAEPSRSRRPDIADLQEPPPPATAQDSEPALEAPEPAEEEAPAMEHEAVPAEQPPAPTGPTTEEREAIAEQPTEMFDVEEELAAASQAEAPSEEELVEEELDEPLAPVDPLPHPDEDEEDDDFWDEKRLSDELDQALEAPAEDEEDAFERQPDQAEPADPEPAPPASREEDVLEETPDFLEEAPEDDQLWFEQKPPKDFDFDD